MMDPAQCATINSALHEEPHQPMTSAHLPEEKVSDNNPDSKEHMKRDVDDAFSDDVAPDKNGAAHTQVKSKDSEASTAPALGNDKAATKSDVNAHQQDPALGTDGDFTGDRITVDAVNGATGNGDAVRRGAVDGDPDEKSKLRPIPLTNGQLEEPVAAPNKGGNFDDIWSPATKLKYRLENTKDLIVCPGVYDGFSARIALSVGFDAMYMVTCHSLLSS